MPNNPNPRFRKLFVVIAVLALTAFAGLAIDRSVEASILDTITDRLTALAVPNRGIGPTETPKRGGKNDDTLGTPSEKFIFGEIVGGSPFDDSTRVDHIFTYDPQTDTKTDLGGINDIEPALSPDGTKIAFVSYRDAPYGSAGREDYRKLYIMNADGSDQRIVYTGNFSGRVYEPSFSPDGNYLVYSAEFNQGTGIFKTSLNPNDNNATTMLADYSTCESIANRGTKGSRKASGRAEARTNWTGFDHPSFSQNGSSVMFGWEYSEWNIYQVSADGTGNCTRLLTNDLSTNFPPEARFSPDGTKVAFYTGDEIINGLSDRTTALHVLDIVSSSVTDYPADELWSSPLWRDNSQIAYIGYWPDPNGSIPGVQIKSFDTGTNGPSQQMYVSGLYDGINGLAVGAPSTVVPEASMRITGPNPVIGGYSTTATLKLRDPAPAGGITFNVVVTDIAVGEVTVPQPTVTVPAGSTEVTIPVNTLQRPDHGRTATIFAYVNAPYYMSAEATVSLRKTAPDLRALSLTAPASVAPDTGFFVDWSVDNIGLVSTGADGGTDRVYFSVDNVLDINADTYVVSSANGTLAAGATRTHTNVPVQYGIPGSLVPADGDYFLILTTNSNQSVDEGGQFANNYVVRPIHVNLPDLVPENLVVPATTEPAVNYTLTWTLRNAGLGNAVVSSTTRVYFSPNTVVGDGDEVQVQSFSNGPVAAGQSFPQSATVSIPSVPVRPDGPGLFYVTVDVNDTVNEGLSGETNNTTSQPTTFQYRVPELQVTASSVASEVETDTPFALSWTTANTGNKATGNFDEQVYFSTDNQVGSDTLLGTFPLMGGLAAGASVDRIQNVTIDTDLIPSSGNYYVYIKTDSSNAQDEGVNEGNNIRFQQVNVRRLQRPELSVTNIVAPAAAFFGEMVTVQWTVTNAGPGPTNAPAWKDRISLNTNGSTSGTIIEVDNATALEAGQSYTMSANVLIPKGYSGSYQFVVTTDIWGALNEENPANNKATKPITISVPPLPDLHIENVQAPAQGYAGGPFEAHWTVKNIGTAVAQDDDRVRQNLPWSWTDSVYLSRDTTLDGGDKLIANTVHTTPLNADATYSSDTWVTEANDNQHWVNLPNDVSGLYYILVRTDRTDVVYEWNSGEGNNVNTSPPQVNIINNPSDLVITDAMVAPAAGNAGSEYQMSFTVRNQGADVTANTWTDAIYLSSDQTLSSDDTVVFSKSNSAIVNQGSKVITGAVTIPFCFQGTQYLIPATDINNNEPEFDPNFDAEANNAGPAHAISLTSQPMDLVATNLSVTPVTPGAAVTVSWTETNTGTGPTPSVWWNRLTLLRSDGTWVATLADLRMDGVIAAGASVARSYAINMPPFMQDTYKIRLEENYYQNVSECSPGTANNTVETGEFTVSNNLPDLAPQNMQLNASSYMAGDPVTINFDEVNLGTNPAVGQNGWATYAYLSTDNTLSGGDRFMGSVNTTAPLASGGTNSLVLNGTIGNVPAGTYYVILFADGANSVIEGLSLSPYEMNNVLASTPITVTLPSVDLTAVVNSVSTPAYSGQNVTLNYTVTNGGTQPTLTANCADRFYLSRDTLLDNTDRQIGWKPHQGVVTAGGSYAESIPLELPAGLTGLYRIIVKTDTSNDVVENSDSNNSSAPFDVTIGVAPPSDLSITNISPPATIEPGGNGTLQFTTQNSGVNAAYGKWRTSFYLSQDQFWDANDYLIGQQERDGAALISGATETATFGFQVPLVPEGQYYVIGRVDSRNAIPESDESNNVAVSGTPTDAATQTLTMGTPNTWTFTASGQQRLFKFLPPLNETVLVTLDGEAGSWNRLITRGQYPASFAEYDYRDGGEKTADQENVVPNTDTDKYYSLVRSDFIPTVNRPADFDKGSKDKAGLSPESTNQDLTITAQTINFSVRGVSPTTAGNKGVTTLKITGAKFQQGASIDLVGGGGSVVIPARLQAVTPTEIQALFDLDQRPAGLYDVRVTNPGNQVATKTGALTVVNGGGHQLRLSLHGPGSVRKVETSAAFTLTVANDGLNDAQSVPLMLSVPSFVNYTIDRANFFDTPQEMLPSDMAPADVPLHFEKDGRKMIYISVPIVRGRSQVSVNVNFTFPMFGSGFSIQYGMGIPWGDLAAGADGILASSGQFHLRNTGEPIVAANDVEFAKCMAEFLRALFFFFENEIMPGSCVSLAKSIISGAIDYFSGIALTKATGQASGLGAATGGIGMWLGIAKNAAECGGKSIPAIKGISLAWGILNLLNQAMDCLQYLYADYLDVIYPLDPNEIIGPKGYGPEKFVGIKQPLEYRINFENVSTATAPAQKVYIEDVLPPGVDPRTVRLKEIGFHHYSYLVPNNAPIYQSRQQLGSDLNDLKADMFAAVDILNRRVTWTITAIDPQTSERPLDPTLGILPPNNDNHDGEGYVIFTIEADAASPNRTDIANKASIIFDENPAIETNVTTNLVDSVVPSSSLTLDPLTDGSTPAVAYSWTGTDDANGSGFESCSIMASESNGSYMRTGVFQVLTGSGSFAGHWGKQYALYSICRDNAGNTEMPPITPDATVQIRGGDTESDVSPRPDGSNGVVDAGDVDQVRQFAAHNDGSMLYNEIQRADSAPKANGGDGAITVADIMQARRFASGLDPRAEAGGPNTIVPFAPKLIDGKRANLLDPRGLSIVRSYRGMNKLRVAIELSAQGDEAATGFSLNFDPAVLSNPILTAGDDGAGGVLTVNSSQAAAGKIGVILDRAPTDVWASGYRFIVLAEFDVIASPPATTVMSFGDDPVKMQTVDGLTNSLAATYSPATIELLAPTASNVSVGGRVIDASGRPVRSATVQLMQSNGGRVRAVTNAFGYFRFDNVVSGSTYVIATTARGLQFPPRVINVSDAITDLEIQAAP